MVAEGCVIVDGMLVVVTMVLVVMAKMINNKDWLH